MRASLSLGKPREKRREGDNAVTTNAIARQRATTALKTLFVGDALAMPVHWFYNPLDIDRAFPGGVTKFESAPAFHPSSIMPLHSTSKGGRGTQNDVAATRQIIGDVILKGRRDFWGQANQHYHCGMQAGENTLNAHCARALMRNIVDSGRQYESAHWLDAYIAFMTANPPLHPDTYAESYHRGFFANLESGKPPAQCAALTHDTPSVGGLIGIAALVFAERLRGTSLEQVQSLAHRHLLLTHPDESLARVCESYVTLLDALLFRDPSGSVAAILLEAGRRAGLDLAALVAKGRGDRDVVGRMFSSACYISDSWPSVLYFAFKYRDQTQAGLIANTNVGGDNVHRGSVLGVILGLLQESAEVTEFEALTESSAIQREIDALLADN
jgi:ADP-ribosylglycohydrolase